MNKNVLCVRTVRSVRPYVEGGEQEGNGIENDPGRCRVGATRGERICGSGSINVLYATYYTYTAVVVVVGLFNI